MICRALFSQTSKFLPSLKLTVATFSSNLSPVNMVIISHLRCSPLNTLQYHIPYCCQSTPTNPTSLLFFPIFLFSKKIPFSPRQANIFNPNLLQKFQLSCAGGNGVGHGSSGGGDSVGGHPDDSSSPSSSSSQGLGIIGLFLNGWRSRVAANSQFPFKVLMEELVGASTSVIGNMLSRPNFGLNELDFIFSNLVVGCTVNFILVYILALIAAASTTSNLPAIFANCPKGHMFETGAYSLLSRLGTLVYKGTIFAAFGFAAGIMGTALSNG